MIYDKNNKTSNSSTNSLPSNMPSLGEEIFNARCLKIETLSAMQFCDCHREELLGGCIRSTRIVENLSFIEAKIFAKQDISSWSVYYQYVLSSVGNIQLNIYARYFSEPIQNNYAIYNLNLFALGEGADSTLYDRYKNRYNVDAVFKVNSVLLNHTTSVELIIIGGDPLTSRGTITTVQPTVSG